MERTYLVQRMEGNSSVVPPNAPECQASLQSQEQADMHKRWKLTLGDDVAFVRELAVGSSGAPEPAQGPQVHGRNAFEWNSHFISPENWRVASEREYFLRFFKT